MCFSFKKKEVGLSLVVVMVIVMRVNTIMTDIMRTKKSIPMGASKDKVDHGDADSRTQEDLLLYTSCLLYTSPSPRDGLLSRMPSSA